MTEKEKKDLLVLARSVITASLIKSEAAMQPENLSPALTEERGCFVTLHKSGMLRGCIGTIEPVDSLFKGVEENAIKAAFSDPRFPQLSIDELGEIDIEISVLTVPVPLAFVDGEDLLRQLKPDVHGVILSQGYRRSTFLPQVWKQLSDPKDFLVNLCKKGGMGTDCWQSTETNVSVYEVEYFGELTVAE
ncbi:MAG: AmmeMemoRadiSam system protein A [Desulfobacterales bacterium]|nr:AmmeMemoRadiSam system protein A [Desulfobacterales bacterium]